MYKKVLSFKKLKEKRDNAEKQYETARTAGDSEKAEHLGNLALTIGDSLDDATADFHYGVCALLEQYFSNKSQRGTNPTKPNE